MTKSSANLVFLVLILHTTCEYLNYMKLVDEFSSKKKNAFECMSSSPKKVSVI